MIVLTHTSGNIWSYNTILPVGTNLGPFEFRFGAMYPGADTVNGGIAYLNNEFPFGVNHSYVLTNQPTAVSNNWFGHPTGPDAVEQIKDIIPDKFKLEQNYPNPFNPTTKIRYSIPEYSSVTLKVFNLLGEEIETLFEGEQPAGVYEAAFDASNLSSGIYFYSLKTDNASLTKKMLLVR
ncbi:MAG: T9SS type A sorting domain-containing protein [Ignavibacterium sp.]|nr:T9SS type A sorting domain-containing protein [Ignavibacterium sp.]